MRERLLASILVLCTLRTSWRYLLRSRGRSMSAIIRPGIMIECQVLMLKRIWNAKYLCGNNPDVWKETRVSRTSSDLI